jgi:hypothetical protein
MHVQISMCMNRFIPQTAQKKAVKENPQRSTKNRVFCWRSKTILHSASAIDKGSRQYPNTQTLWKNDLKQKIIGTICHDLVGSKIGSYIVPPSNLVLMVTAMAPTQTITNTSANSGPPSWSVLSLLPCSNLHTTSDYSVLNCIMRDWLVYIKSDYNLQCHKCAQNKWSPQVPCIKSYIYLL